jgi:hypothetical protein
VPAQRAARGLPPVGRRSIFPDGPLCTM